MKTLTLLSLFFLWFSPSDTPATVTVSVKPLAEVSGKNFTLGEIAEVTGDDKAFVNQVANVEIGVSPLPGLSRSLFQGSIMMSLRFYKIDVKRINLVCPPSIRITRSNNEVPAQEITDAAKAVLLAARGNKGDEANILASPLTAKYFVGQGKREYKAGAPTGSLDNGNVFVPVTILVNGKPEKTVQVGFSIKQTVMALVAVHPIELNSVITDQDVTLTQIELPNPKFVPITDPATVVGKHAKQRLAQGLPLQPTFFEGALVIKSGANVQIESVQGTIKITAPGVARGQGAVGDRIQVLSTETKKILNCIIVDANTVRVENIR